MVSAAEQFASNLSLSSFSKSKDLRQRLLFTLLALIFYRVGTYIPIPGVDPMELGRLMQTNASGILGWFNSLAGGALGRMSLFALNIMPYVTASIIVQLMTSLSPHLEQLKKEGGEHGRQKINQYTRYGTVVLSVAYAYGIALGLESQGRVVLEPGLFFRMSTVVTLTGGTILLMWVGEQITARGIGNGISLIIFSGIVAGLPAGLSHVLELGRSGQIPTLLLLLVLVICLGVIAFIVFMERAQRRITIQYPRRQSAHGVVQSVPSHLPLKLNTAGVIPPIFASSLLLLPITIANFSQGSGPEWLSYVTALLGHGQPLFMLFYVSLIVFFAFFYTALMFNPVETADNLKKHEGFVPGVRPGERTAEYIDKILTRVTLIGAVYLALVCIFPEFLIYYAKMQFYFGGTSLLIVVTVTIDTVSQIQGHLYAQQYEGLVKKTQLGKKGKR